MTCTSCCRRGLGPRFSCMAPCQKAAFFTVRRARSTCSESALVCIGLLDLKSGGSHAVPDKPPREHALRISPRRPPCGPGARQKAARADAALAPTCSVDANSTTCAFVTIIRLCASKIQPEPVDLTGVSLVQGTLQSFAADAQNTCTTAGKNGSRLPRSSSSMQDVGVLSPALLWRLTALEEPPERTRERDDICNRKFSDGATICCFLLPLPCLLVRHARLPQRTHAPPPSLRCAAADDECCCCR